MAALEQNRMKSIKKSLPDQVQKTKFKKSSNQVKNTKLRKTNLNLTKQTKIIQKNII